jgi:acyl dehydratase
VPLDPSLVGRSFGPTPPYDVTEDSVRAFAAATGTPYRTGDPAPVTYPIVVAFPAMTALMEDPDAGIRLQNVVHGEQRFGYTRPVRVGDTIAATLTVESIRSLGGADIIGTRSVVTDADGAVVCTAKATLVHRGES